MAAAITRDELVAWLTSQHDLHGWWMCYNANAALLETSASSCLAHHLGADVNTTEAITGHLVGRGITAAKRAELLGGVALHTCRVSIERSWFSFLWLGTEEKPSWTAEQQLAGSATRLPPAVPRLIKPARAQRAPPVTPADEGHGKCCRRHAW